MDVAGYRAALMARFANPALRHRTQQIAMDGSQKLPQRLVAPWRARLERGPAFADDRARRRRVDGVAARRRHAATAGLPSMIRWRKDRDGLGDRARRRPCRRSAARHSRGVRRPREALAEAEERVAGGSGCFSNAHAIDELAFRRCSAPSPRSENPPFPERPLAAWPLPASRCRL
jgi:hypothetical protein